MLHAARSHPPRSLVAVLLVWCLTLVSAAATAAHAGTDPTDRQLVTRFESAEVDRPERALDAALELTRRHPRSAVWAFNAGRMHARLGDEDEALALLQRAADLGHSGVASFEQHTDLDPLRQLPGFAPILDRVRANAEARMATFQEAARAHEPPTHVPDALPSDAKPPLLIALHGSGGTGRPMLDALRAACDELGIVCVAPDALRPAGAGFAWTYRDESEWFVEHLIEQATETHGTDPDRVILLGFSQGANIAMVLARTRPDRFAAVIPICGHYEPNLAPVTDAPAPTYLLTTSRDPQRRTYNDALVDLKAHQPKTVLRTASGGHELPSRRELLRALEWAMSPSDD